MVLHCVKALGIAPESLHDWLNLRWQLPHLTHQPFQRSCCSRTKDPDEVPRRAWRATGEKRQARADHTDMRMPLLPGLHPRMVSEYDGPTPNRRLQPPGFMALNYGRRTPVVAIVAHVMYGAIIGHFYRLADVCGS
jgi:hypothetical protein